MNTTPSDDTEISVKEAGASSACTATATRGHRATHAGRAMSTLMLTTEFMTRDALTFMGSHQKLLDWRLRFDHLPFSLRHPADQQIYAHYIGRDFVPNKAIHMSGTECFRADHVTLDANALEYMFRSSGTMVNHSGNRRDDKEFFFSCFSPAQGSMFVFDILIALVFNQFRSVMQAEYESVHTPGAFPKPNVELWFDLSEEVSRRRMGCHVHLLDAILRQRALEGYERPGIRHEDVNSWKANPLGMVVNGRNIFILVEGLGQATCSAVVVNTHDEKAVVSQESLSPANTTLKIGKGDRLFLLA